MAFSLHPDSWTVSFCTAMLLDLNVMNLMLQAHRWKQCNWPATNPAHGAESFLRSWQSLSWTGNSPPFMEPTDSVPCSQEPSTSPCLEPDESSPYPQTLFVVRSSLRQGCIQKFPDWVDNKISNNSKHSLRSYTEDYGGKKFTRLTHEIAIQLHLVAEGYTVCSFRSRRSARKLLVTPSYFPRIYA
jgi:hypothetical protein